MTFDREPDLDNANVGMPDTRRIFAEATKQGYFRFFACEAESCGITLFHAFVGKRVMTYDEQHERGNAKHLRVCVCFTRKTRALHETMQQSG